MVCRKCAVVIDQVYEEYIRENKLENYSDGSSSLGLFVIYDPKKIKDIIMVIDDFCDYFGIEISIDHRYKHIPYIMGKHTLLEFKYPSPHLLFTSIYLYHSYIGDVQTFTNGDNFELKNFVSNQKGVRQWNKTVRLACNDCIGKIEHLHNNKKILSGKKDDSRNTREYSNELLDGYAPNLENIINRERKLKYKFRRTVREICDTVKRPVSSYYYHQIRIKAGIKNQRPGPKQRRNAKYESEIIELSKTMSYRKIEVHLAITYNVSISKSTISDIINSGI